MGTIPDPSIRSTSAVDGYTWHAMPVYEFACNACRAKVSVFVRSMSSEVNAVCDRCGGRNLQRLISRVTVLRGASNSGGLDDGGMLDDVDYNDPRSIARWARSMRDEMGEDAGPEFDEALERMERGDISMDELLGEDGHDHGDDDFADDDFKL
jgi:putative FmdB family regulatory protein